MKLNSFSSVGHFFSGLVPGPELERAHTEYRSNARPRALRFRFISAELGAPKR